jgi:hypothetical protein
MMSFARPAPVRAGVPIDFARLRLAARSAVAEPTAPLAGRRSKRVAGAAGLDT